MQKQYIVTVNLTAKSSEQGEDLIEAMQILMNGYLQSYHKNNSVKFKEV